MTQSLRLGLPRLTPQSRRWLWVAVIVIAAGFTRLWAAWQLPPDADEPVYLKAGQEYAGLIRQGNWQAVMDYPSNREHPALVKLVYAVPYLIYEPEFGSSREITFNRMVSAAFGTLAVLVLALIDPLAGAFLALDSMVIKYTSQVYLESIPLFSSLLALAFLRRGLKETGFNRWLVFSAASLGISGAGKYLYFLTGVPLVVMFLSSRKVNLRHMLVYGGFAALFFFAFNPSLWFDPFNRLWQSITFHTAYTSSRDVLRANYPWYQAVNWITSPVPWHANVFFFPTSDVPVFLLVFVGMVREVRQRLWSVVWMACALITLLVWPTKWPQYTLVLIPAMCLVASTGVSVILRYLREFEATWHWLEVVLPKPGKLFYGAITVFVLVLLTGKLWYEFDMAAARKGWILVKSEFTPLPSNSINDIRRSPAGEVVMATNQGVVIWKADVRSPWGEQEKVLTPDNAGLAHPVVRRLLLDSRGNWWFGTQAGLSVLSSNNQWRTFNAKDLGLESDEILSLAEDAAGTVWAGTKSGAAFLRAGQTMWQAVTSENSGLPSGPIFAIAGQVGTIWFATQTGVSFFQSESNTWRTFDLDRYGFNWMGVTDLFVDKDGRMWVATLGDGVNLTDGESWITYRTGNSKIPGNSVTRIQQGPDGVMWFGFSYSTEPGGFLASLSGQEWRVYSPKNSGFSGGEPAAFIFDEHNRLWVGTKMDGVSIYQPAATR